MSNWIKWEGGACPVAQGTLVDVIHRDGDKGYEKVVGKRDTGRGEANAIEWEHTGSGGDIVKYRLCQPDLQSRLNDANLQQVLQSDNKYNRQCKGVTIDVYDVLLAFNVTNPALQHLVKKALCTGLRGHKDKSQDLQDILESAKRALELETGK